MLAWALTGPAWAGNLPGQAPDAAMRICSAFGSGYFYIPGSDICLKLGGRIRFEILVNEIWSRGQPETGFRSRGRFDFDARSQTDYGVLRATMRLQSTISSGAYSRSVPAYDNNSGTPENNSQLQRAFIEFAGFTAGRFNSFFDFYGNDLNWGGTLGSARGPINGFAYTASFNSGLSTTLSLENPTNRTVAEGNLALAGGWLPEIVGAVRFDQNWGSAQLSGVLHPLRPLYNDAFTSGSSQLGWAIQAGLKLNLPVLAEGDVLWGQAAYADGAVNYLGLGRNSFRIGRLRYTLSDAYFAGNTMQLTTGYSLTAAFSHYWMPTVQQSAFASYGQADPTGPAAATVSRASKAGLWQIGSNLIWSPLKDLEIGGELMWYQLSGSKTLASTDPGYPPLNRDNAWQFRARIQRDF